MTIQRAITIEIQTNSMEPANNKTLKAKQMSNSMLRRWEIAS